MKVLKIAATMLALIFAAPVASHADDLRIGMRIEPVMDPHYFWSGNYVQYYRHYLGFLITLDPPAKLVPSLAEKWEASDTGWTFHLRPHVRFSDGSAFSATDVVASYKRARDYPKAAGLYAGLFANVTIITAVDLYLEGNIMTVWSLGAVGDVLVNRPDPEDAFRAASDLLHTFDVVFGNCEAAYTDRPHFAPSAGFRVFSPGSDGRGLAKAGFDVMALANNHILDAGYEGLSDTMALLRSQGIKTVGAGANLSEAREAAIVEQGGRKMGFLGFASVFPSGYDARGSVPGLAAMRVHSFVMSHNYHDPGTPPEISTVPYPEDVELLRSLIADLRSKVDVVVVSHHWGQYRPVHLTAYERTLGHASIDAGADIVLGHHHHFLRGVEIYRGKPIFYGLGHYVFDTYDVEMTGYLRKEMGEYAIYPRDGFPRLPFHPDARMTMAASIDFDGEAIASVGFFPCLINPDNHAVPFRPEDPRAQEIVDYVARISAEVGFETSYASVSEKHGFAYSSIRL